MIDWGHTEIPITRQAHLLGLNRSGLYYKPAKPSIEEVRIKHRIDEIYTKWPFYGLRRITAQLQLEGLSINRKAVQRHMREMGIAGICPGPNLSKRNNEHKVYPYLLKNVQPCRPNHVWGIDITYIRLTEGWMYLVAIVDWYSRYIVAWELDQTLEIDFVLTAATTALAKTTPEFFNSDQGSQFTSLQYIRLLQETSTKISMDGKGRAFDNIITERFWRTLKYEEVYLREYGSPRAARKGINSYMGFYNDERPHQSLKYKPPAALYKA